MKAMMGCLGLLLVGGAPAFAQDIEFENLPAEEEEQVEEQVETNVDNVHEQWVSAAVGLEVGGRLSPGGLKLSGSHFYQLTDSDWLRSSLSYTFGGDQTGCAMDEFGETNCNRDYLAGTAVAGSAGLRRFFKPMWDFLPYAELGVAAKFVSFSGDGVRGFALPATLAGGARKTVAEGVAVSFGLGVEAGFGYFNRDLGWEPQVTVGLSGGVDFDIL
jgi:hypothetical protein